jgi:hypothetical protein
MTALRHALISSVPSKLPPHRQPRRLPPLKQVRKLQRLKPL